MVIIQFIQDSLFQILTFLASSGSVFLYYRTSKRIKRAEADKSEIANEVTLAHEWKDVAENREAKLNLRDAKIDSLYEEISKWRDKYNTLLLAKNKADIEIANMTVKMCNKRSCDNREPQSGY